MKSYLGKKNKLYKKSSIPMIITFYIFLIYFVYLMQNALLKTTWDFPTKILMPVIIVSTLVFALSFELLYHQKIEKPLQFHLRRFGMNMLLVLVGAFSVFAFLLFVDATLSPYLGGRAILLGLFLWSLIFFVIVVKYRRFLRF
jgi:hypothetical protein